MIDLWQRVPSYMSNVAVWVFLVSLITDGCSAKELPSYPTQKASSYPYFQENDGLAIGIKPLTNPQESELYFDTDLLSRGVLAIFVSAGNRESAKNFLLLKERFNLQTALKEELRVSGREQVNSRG